MSAVTTAGELRQPGWTLYCKGGWGYGTGPLDHQIVLIKRGCARVDDRRSDDVRRLPRVWQADALRDLLRPPAGLSTHWRLRSTR